jgi:hypothetical protein
LKLSTEQTTEYYPLENEDTYQFTIEKIIEASADKYEDFCFLKDRKYLVEIFNGDKFWVS